MKKNLEKAIYMGIGAVIAFISFSLGNIHRDTASAQEEAPIVDLIRCRQLEIVNAQGRSGVVLESSEHGGNVFIFGKEAKGAALGIGEHGGLVRVFGKEGKLGIGLGISERGGFVTVHDKEDEIRTGLGITEHGGSIVIFNKAKKIVGELDVGDTGGGVLNIRDKHGYKIGSVP